MKKRGFEVVTNYQAKDINLPERATKNAAGYDFESAEDIVIPTFWKKLVAQVTGKQMQKKNWLSQYWYRQELRRIWERTNTCN